MKKHKLLINCQGALWNIWVCYLFIRIFADDWLSLDRLDSSVGGGGSIECTRRGHDNVENGWAQRGCSVLRPLSRSWNNSADDSRCRSKKSSSNVQQSYWWSRGDLQGIEKQGKSENSFRSNTANQFLFPCDEYCEKLIGTNKRFRINHQVEDWFIQEQSGAGQEASPLPTTIWVTTRTRMLVVASMIIALS